MNIYLTDEEVKILKEVLDNTIYEIDMDNLNEIKILKDIFSKL